MSFNSKVLKNFIRCATTIMAMCIFALVLGWPDAVSAASPIKIDSAHFPDDTFRSVVESKYDYNQNGYIEEDEILITRNIVCEYMGVSSVKGIEYFTEMQGLWVMSALRPRHLRRSGGVLRPAVAAFHRRSGLFFGERRGAAAEPSRGWSE